MSSTSGSAAAKMSFTGNALSATQMSQLVLQQQQQQQQQQQKNKQQQQQCRHTVGHTGHTGPASGGVTFNLRTKLNMGFPKDITNNCRVRQTANGGVKYSWTKKSMVLSNPVNFTDWIANLENFLSLAVKQGVASKLNTTSEQGNPVKLNRSFVAKGSSTVVDLTSDDVTIATVVKQETKVVVKEEEAEGEKSHIKQPSKPTCRKRTAPRKCPSAEPYQPAEKKKCGAEVESTSSDDLPGTSAYPDAAKKSTARKRTAAPSHRVRTEVAGSNPSSSRLPCPLPTSSRSPSPPTWDPDVFIVSPESATSQRRQSTPLKLEHPAPLPTLSPQPTSPHMKTLPPRPSLNVVYNGRGIVLNWNMSVPAHCEEIVSYQLFAYQEGTAPPSSSLWKKIGEPAALALPMACTLTKFQFGNTYHFAVRAVDKHKRFGPYSQPSTIYIPK